MNIAEGCISPMCKRSASRIISPPDCYFAAVAEYRKRSGDSAQRFFPNIELRTNDVVNKEQEEVNIHLLFNPFHPDHGRRSSPF